MKTLTILISLLFLSLSFQPCSDVTNKDHITEEKTNTDHNHREDTDDSCPVTCSCDCCGMVIALEVLQPLRFKVYPKIASVVFDNYKLHYQYDGLFGIWQPPKMLTNTVSVF